jgi:hypothetical protein
MNKICLLQQEAGIGDVFFCQNIAKKYIDEGYRVIWPLSSTVYMIKDYLCVDGVEYYDNTTDFPFKDKFEQLYHSKKFINSDEFVFIPMGWGSHVVSNRVMPAKYQVCDMDYTKWKNNISIRRNIEKEKQLRLFLQIEEGEKYCLSNCNFVTPPDIHHKDVSPAYKDLDLTDVKHVAMNIIPDFTVFDWCGIIEDASYIVTVDTCIMYIMEFLKLKSKKNCCFPRWGKNTINEIHDLFENSWTYYI